MTSANEVPSPVLRDQTPEITILAGVSLFAVTDTGVKVKPSGSVW